MSELLPLEERKKIVERIFVDNTGFLNDSPVKALENRRFGDHSCTGYNVVLGNLSYRGVWLSTIEDIRLTVDGEDIDPNVLCINLKGAIYPVSALKNYTEIFWGVKDKCMIIIPKLGGLAAGTHTVTIDITKREDFGHHFGNGTEGYENAPEFTHPGHIRFTSECVVE